MRGVDFSHSSTQESYSPLASSTHIVNVSESSGPSLINWQDSTSESYSGPCRRGFRPCRRRRRGSGLRYRGADRGHDGCRGCFSAASAPAGSRGQGMPCRARRGCVARSLRSRWFFTRSEGIRCRPAESKSDAENEGSSPREQRIGTR